MVFMILFNLDETTKTSFKFKHSLPPLTILTILTIKFGFQEFGKTVKLAFFIDISLTILESSTNASDVNALSRLLDYARGIKYFSDFFSRAFMPTEAWNESLN